MGAMMRTTQRTRGSKNFMRCTRCSCCFGTRNSLVSSYEEGQRHPQTIFRAVDRLKLTREIIEADVVVGGAGMPVDARAFHKHDVLECLFPLHNKPQLSALQQRWLYR